MGGSLYVGLHVRRTDKLGAWPDGCAEPPAVLWNVASRTRRVSQAKHLGQPPPGIFVLTDEREAAYLQRLRVALGRHFSKVRFESELPRKWLHDGDNHYAYSFARSVAATRDNYHFFVDYHPDLRDVMWVTLLLP